MNQTIFSPEQYPLHSWAALKEHGSRWDGVIATLNWLLGEDA